MRLIGAFVALDFVESRQSEHSWSSGVAKQVIDKTHCCHRMTVRAAGGRGTGCVTLTRCEQQQQR